MSQSVYLIKCKKCGNQMQTITSNERLNGSERCIYCNGWINKKQQVIKKVR